MVKFILELDPNSYYEDTLEWTHPAFLRFLQECDVIGASCHRMQKCLGQKWPCVVEYLPNGFYNFDQLDMAVDFGRKGYSDCGPDRFCSEAQRRTAGSLC